MFGRRSQRDFEDGQIVWDTVSFEWLDALEQIGATISGPKN